MTAAAGIAWKRGRFRVHAAPADFTVDGWVSGFFGIDNFRRRGRQRAGLPGWGLTHLGSGCLLGTFRTLGDAKACAAAIATRHRWGSMTRALSPRNRRWLRTCDMVSARQWESWKR